MIVSSQTLRFLELGRTVATYYYNQIHNARDHAVHAIERSKIDIWDN